MIFFYSDIFIYLLVILLPMGIIKCSRHPQHKKIIKQLLSSGGMNIAIIVLLIYLLIGFLDSIHLKHHDTKNPLQQSITLLDSFFLPLLETNEKLYSKPFAWNSLDKKIIVEKGQKKAVDAHLNYVSKSIVDNKTRNQDLLHFVYKGMILAALCVTSFLLATMNYQLFKNKYLYTKIIQNFVRWRFFWFALTGIILLFNFVTLLTPHYHILGTNKIGNDVFYLSLKSIRTSLIFGLLTISLTIPLAIFFGTLSGYFQGWIDDVIQYIYTVISSIPSILLIAAAALSLHLYLTKNTYLQGNSDLLADAQLVALCVILGSTGWVGLCRLIRSETLKLREMDFVQAARSLGVSHLQIIRHHIIPHVWHIILITEVLEFSSLILAEAVLSYIGIGVSPLTPSFGNMINDARLELGRDPVVWWPLLSAFTLMLGLVLAANVFADGLRDALDAKSQ